jgi:dynein heavy chain
MVGQDETAGPLEEIDFWKARSQDLMGISKQLNKHGVKNITKLLHSAKSSYVSSFIKLARQIQVNKAKKTILYLKIS